MRKKDEERLADLWKRWKQERDIDARDDLIQHYHHLAPLTTNRVLASVRKRRGIEREEAQAEAVLALLRAVEGFDPDYGTKFETFAFAWIRGHLYEWLERNDWASRGEREKIRRGEKEEVRQVSLSDTWDRAEAVPDPGESPEYALISRYEREAVNEYLEQLGEVDRLMLEAYFWGDLTQKEIGELFGLREGKVQRRIQGLVQKGRKAKGER